MSRPPRITATNARFRTVPGAPGPLTARQALAVQAARDLTSAGEPATVGAIARRTGMPYDTAKAIVRRLREIGVKDFKVVPYRELPRECGKGAGRPPGAGLTEDELATRIEAARRDVEARRAAGTLRVGRERGGNQGRAAA